jgi:hypothetical protein
MIHIGNVYVPNRENDLEIVRWWVRLERDGDLDKLMMEGARSVSDLFRLVQPPKAMLWELDDDGPWFAMWFEQCFTGAFCGAWMRRDRRGSRKGVHAFLDAWTWALVAWPVLIGVTKQPDLLGIHRRVGYTTLGAIPGIFDGQEATIMYLTRSAFRETLRRLRRPTAPLDALLDPQPRIADCVVDANGRVIA